MKLEKFIETNVNAWDYMTFYDRNNMRIMGSPKGTIDPKLLNKEIINITFDEDDDFVIILDCRIAYEKGVGNYEII